MQYLIAKLVTDFESGKLNRRELIQGLGLAITAASGSTATEAASPKGFHATGINHISYEVADYARTRDFYADLLGMKISADNGQECELSFGDTLLLPRKRMGNRSRVDHIAYTIANWDKTAVAGELKRRGLRPQPDDAAGEESFHIIDPDGFDVQICSGPLRRKAR